MKTVPSPVNAEDDPTSEYVIRCVVCGHKIGTTPDPDETKDVCDRCDT